MKYILGLFDIVFAVSLFFVLIYSYYLGMKHGKKLAQGEIPKVGIKPLRVVKKATETKEEKETRENAHEGWYGENGIMNYNPYNSKEGE